MSQYQRRLETMAKDEIAQAVEQAEIKVEPFDGAKLGAQAADKALDAFGFANVRELSL